jgi:hypothetical protein
MRRERTSVIISIEARRAVRSVPIALRRLRTTETGMEAPQQIRATLTDLIARLLLNHARDWRIPRRGRCAMSLEKIRPHHLERKAMLYVRQSSAHQVLHNRRAARCNTRCGIA